MRFEDFFQAATERAPYSFQSRFAAAPVLPDLLEAPTGTGKTATAVLGWLWRRLHGTSEQRREAGRRLVFCLPMRTLVEQTEKVVLTWRERLGLDPQRLGVHMLMGGAVDDAWEAFPERDAVLIGTQDQLLSRALMRGYAMSRYLWPVHFALLNNDCTWIMDEVQLMGVGASTAAQLQAFREQMSTAGSTRTVWMTATLSKGRLQTVDAQRELSSMLFSSNEPALEARLRAAKSLSRAEAESGKKGSLTQLAREIARAHERGTLTLVIVNRVSRAQELRALLANDRSVEATALIHSRFRPADRRRIQAAALNGEFRGVLIATQAIEAGVDISAMTLFTELAPWSSLVQRFGRLNRAGEHTKARAIWIDLDTSDDEVCLPYDAATLTHARTCLANLTDVSPRALASIDREVEHPVLPVLRRKDLLELFDTEPDLAGHDIDISRYVRATTERDVQVSWRALGQNAPDADAPDLHRDELCSVPFYELEKLARGHKIWRFDSLQRKWVVADRIFPGLTVVVDVTVGGYDSETGFTRDKSSIPVPIECSAPPADYDESDELTLGAADYVTLALHAEDTAHEMAVLLDHLSTTALEIAGAEQFMDPARWHDLGKAHPAFQRMITARLDPSDPRKHGGPWAKSDGKHGGKHERRFFRHELASALAWLAAGRPDFGAFLIAAHHGKVRLSLRARPGEEPPADRPRTRFAHGIYDGDVLPSADLGHGIIAPQTTLSLACMELGGGDDTAAWADRMLGLLEEHGPFRLAYAEMLIRIADWRATARRRPGGGGEDA